MVNKYIYIYIYVYIYILLTTMETDYHLVHVSAANTSTHPDVIITSHYTCHDIQRLEISHVHCLRYQVLFVRL